MPVSIETQLKNYATSGWRANHLKESRALSDDSVRPRTQAGLPRLILVDSGNGHQVAWKVPPTDPSVQGRS